MKINPGFRPLGQELARSETSGRPVQTKSFADLMSQKDEQRSQEQLQQKIRDIQAQGERLARSMTVRELKLYRSMVKQFLEDTLKRGVGLKDTRGWDRRGRTKRYKLLEQVDAMLIQMGEELLDNEQGRIDLLHRVGEIRGILLNVFF